MSNQRYMMRGVSASKEDVHNAIKNIDKGIFPQAFCKIIPGAGMFLQYDGAHKSYKGVPRKGAD